MKNSEAQVKQQVQMFYDQVGWNRTESGSYVDSERAEDLRPVSAEYRRRCHLRVNRYLTRGPGLLLDIASGPVQYPEYQTYAEGFSGRICADLSRAALVEARKRLGEQSRYVQCDITALPFRSETLPGVVSLHTIFHVPAEEQLSAFLELYRVLKPGATGVVVYSWGGHSLWMRLAGILGRVLRLPGGLLRRLRRWIRKEVRPSEPPLYFHAHDWAWFEQNLRPRVKYEIVPWRSLDVAFLKTYIHAWFFGKALLRLTYWMEEKWPAFFGKFGAYPMFVLKKEA